MHQPRRRGRQSALRTLLVVAAVASGTAGSVPPAAAVVQPRPDLTTCFWTLVAGAPPATNRLVSDPNELAFAAWVVLPRGGTLRLRHRFPHARSVAWSTYDPVSFSPVDTLRDHQLVAEPGATNPFTAGADRGAADRGYTMTISSAREPAGGGAPNTLYTNGKTVVGVFYRLYLPDRGRDRLGDAGLPDVAYQPFRWGPTLTGSRACLALNGGRAVAAPLNEVIWNSTAVGLTLPYLSMLQLRPESTTFPARPEGAWDAFFNFARLAEPLLRGTALEGRIRDLPEGRGGPAADWAADTAVAFNYVDLRLGPEPGGRNVLVLRGRMPRTPRTIDGAPLMDGDVDLRYWSLCKMTAIPLGVTGACLHDEQVPLDADRRYTIVMSTAADRPENATAACGVGWLDAGTVGDGYGRRTAGTLVLRNQDPSPGFGRSIQDVARPGQEREVMGDYLPEQAYASREAFEATGCAGRTR